MHLEDAINRLRGCGYQILRVDGEQLCMVFWPPDKEQRRKTQALNYEELIGLAESVTLAGDEHRHLVDLQRIGVVANLRKMPATTDADGEPTLQLVFEITGKRAVRSLPIAELRDMLGQQVLLQLQAVQFRLDLAAADHAK